MRTDPNSLRMYLKTALDNLWARITTRVDGIASNLAGVTTRVGAAEGRLDDVEDSIDDLDGDMIKGISLNGTNVPKDAQGNVALQESDPTVPSWAKQVKAKTSDFTNDGDGTGNNSPFATQAYVEANGGKIDEVQVNGVALQIVDKTVDVPVPTRTSELTNDSGFGSINYINLDLHDTDVYWIYKTLNDGLAFTDMRPFKAGSTAMSLVTNNQLSRSVYGYVERYIAASWRFFIFIAVDTLNGNLYVIQTHCDEPMPDSTTVFVDYIKTLTEGGGGGGGSGAVDTITFDGALHTPDANGNVSLTETDPTVPAWAKAASKPTYTASEVGALPASTPIPSKTSDLTNDSGFLTSSTGVTGVKGNAEASYRKGNVNLTPANIGAPSTTGSGASGTWGISVTGNAATATKATQDGSGNNIGSTYLKMNTAGGIASCSGGGSNSYFRIATVKITKAYINRPIVFEISGRGWELSWVQLIFKNSSGTDPDLESFTTNNWPDFWVKKTATSTWEVYGKYGHPSYGEATLHRLTGSGADIGVTVDMVNIGTTEPSGATKAVYSGNVSHANTAGNVTGTVAVSHGGTGATTKAGARAGIGIHTKDVTIPVGGTEADTELAISSYEVISLTQTNPYSAVCTIKGAHPLGGTWRIVCDAVQVGTAAVRVLYVDK